MTINTQRYINMFQEKIAIIGNRKICAFANRYERLSLCRLLKKKQL